ncbi:outer membrane beta-barrel protein [Mucilaginibacter sp. FT3.2]|uniref:outer membrane beta-barrel protein n=1 Tax=Mucilaginibacter sp. FT3.2 TaxID=2723090 RepID=UPI00160F4096|nr:outer membrane beta-barrel protein [Mucilaginibacter sp. FT3.2]MBB6233609.1 hypothetical protein [Mucilaginibacter sp. FT3.2]
MKKLLIALLFLIPLSSFAQPGFTGTVKDSTGHGLDAVSVVLKQQGRFVEAVTTITGHFNMKRAPAGKYELTASLTGYKAVTKSISIPLDSLQIIMQADRKQLQDVIITGSRPAIEHKIDRLVFNVENSIAASGGSAWDALGKAPGVQLGSDGTITANRKDAQVYLDGKPLHINGDDLSGYLQGLLSATIAKIEVYSNPPASFDAQGAAVINIITKKSNAQGGNLTVNGGYTKATYSGYTAGVMFNYRQKALNIYGNYGYTDRNRTMDQDDYAVFTTPGNVTNWYAPGHTINRSRMNMYKLGADYQINKNQVLGFVMTGSNRTGNTTTSSITTVTNGGGLLDSLLHTDGLVNRRSNRYTFNVNYNLKLDTAQSLNVDLDYSPFRNFSDQSVQNISTLPDGSTASGAYQIFTPSKQELNIYTAKLDYNFKAGKWAVTSGLKYSSIQTGNKFDYFNEAGADPVFIKDRSDNFSYTENTAAIYTSASRNFGRWSLQVGLREEFTHNRGYSETLDSLNSNQYFKLFPTLSASYKLENENTVSITYGYRIQRPEYYRLNPLKVYKTPYDILAGNPSLKPAFVQNLEVSYGFKHDFTLTAFYTKITDRYSNATVQDNVNKLFYDIQQNIGNVINTGLRAFLPLHPSSWWEMSNSAEAYYQRDELAYLHGSFNYNKFAVVVNSSQAFTLDKKLGLKAELTGDYYSDGSEGIFRGGGDSEVNAGVKLNLFHSQASLKLAANDIFYGNVNHYRVTYLGQNNGFYQQNDTRSMTVSFTYRLGKNVAEARKRNTASEDEKRRAQ